MGTELLEGNRRYRDRDWPSKSQKLRALADGQMPTALYLGCADSRVVPDVFLDAGPGELFVVRQIAAIVPPPEHAAARPLAAALEYALEHLEVRHVIVCGHDRCGGLSAILEGDGAPGSRLGEWLAEAAIDPILRRTLAGLPRAQAVERFVSRQLQTLSRYPSVEQALIEDRLTLHGWVYDLTNAQVRVRDERGVYRVPTIDEEEEGETQRAS